MISKLNSKIFFSNSKQLIRRFSDDSSQTGRVHNTNIEKTPITSALWKQRFSKLDGTTNINSNNNNTLEYATISKSAMESIRGMRYHFSTDNNLRDLYVDNSGNVAMGKLFEDLDALAGNVVFYHCLNLPNEKSIKDSLNISNFNVLSMVTACVDDIVLHKRNISCHSDIILCGQVGWVGNSSVDVVVEVHAIPRGSSDSKHPIKHDSSKTSTPTIAQLPIDSQTQAAVTILSTNEIPQMMLNNISDSTRLMSSIVTYVARNKISGKAMTVNKLDISNATIAEKEFYETRENLSKTRKNRSKEKYTLDMKDIELLKSLVDSGCSIEDMPTLSHPNAVLMKSTRLENSFICQPQATNTGTTIIIIILLLYLFGW